MMNRARRAMRRLFPDRATSAKVVTSLTAGLRGLEIGGPSRALFGSSGLLPVYPVVGSLDNVNFSAQTVWEGTIEPGKTFVYQAGRDPGLQIIGEATTIPSIAPAAYQCLLSSHTLEHTANPIAALTEWLRVLTDDGLLILVVPHKDGTFDHRRPLTTLTHLTNDFARGIDEHDLTHLPEILQHHDLAMDRDAGTPSQFKARSLQNFENRCLHHHTFSTPSLARLLDHMGLQILSLEARRPYHIMAAARKTAAADNRAFLAPDAAYAKASPFRLDREAETLRSAA